MHDLTETGSIHCVFHIFSLFTDLLFLRFVRKKGQRKSYDWIRDFLHTWKSRDDGVYCVFDWFQKVMEKFDKCKEKRRGCSLLCMYVTHSSHRSFYGEKNQKSSYCFAGDDANLVILLVRSELYPICQTSIEQSRNFFAL